ncbi:hypothetical protein QEK82_004655, partial [Stenotrophomonas maltophilia]
RCSARLLSVSKEPVFINRSMTMLPAVAMAHFSKIRFLRINSNRAAFSAIQNGLKPLLRGVFCLIRGRI